MVNWSGTTIKKFRSGSFFALLGSLLDFLFQP
jgi:hypothetical protein